MSAIDGKFTVEDVVTDALKKAGIMGLGQSPYPSGSDKQDAQNSLSYMLASWNSQTWLVWHKLDLSFKSDGRSTPYLLGPTGDSPGFVLSRRPDRIEAAYLRFLANTSIIGSGMPVDQSLGEVQSMEQYSRVALKQLVAFPKEYFYDPAVPNGNVFFYPWPSAGLYEMHIIIKDFWPTILPMNTDLSMLPMQAREAMEFNLARRLRQAYGKGLRPDPELNALAKQSLEVLRTSQVQVPELSLPPMVLGRGSLYNIYGDTLY